MHFGSSSAQRAPEARKQSGAVGSGTQAHTLRAIQRLREDLFRVWMEGLTNEAAQDAAAAAIDDLIGLALLVRLIRQLRPQAMASIGHVMAGMNRPSVRGDSRRPSQAGP